MKSKSKEKEKEKDKVYVEDLSILGDEEIGIITSGDLGYGVEGSGEDNKPEEREEREEREITPEEFSAAASKYYPRILNYCGKRMGWHSDYEDVCQTAFLKASKSLSSFKASSSLYTWFHRIASNTVTDWQRKEYRAKFKKVKLKSDGGPSDGEYNEVSSEEIYEGNTEPKRSSNIDKSDPYEKLKGKDIQKAVNEIIESVLLEKEYEVFDLVSVQGMSIKQASKESGIDEQALRNRLHSARGKIKGALISRGLVPKR